MEECGLRTAEAHLTRAIVAAVAAVSLPLALGSAPRLGAVASLLTVLALLATWGMRWRLRVDDEGVHYTSIILWLVPTWRAHYWLDAEVYACGDDDWSNDGPTLAVRNRAGRAGDRDALFGPTREPELSALAKRINDGIAAFREQVPREPLLALRARWLPPATRPLGRHSSGRITRWVNEAALTIGTTSIPAGSTFGLNMCAGYGWVDPRRDDVLDDVTLSAATPLTERGLVAQAGASIRFGDRGEVSAVRNAVRGIVEAEYRGCRMPLDGAANVSWDADGEIAGGRLALDANVGGLRIPAGSELTSFTQIRIFELSAPMALPELALRAGARLHYTRNALRGVGMREITNVMLRGRRWRLAGAGALIPLHQDGRIDLRAGRRLGNITECEGTR